MSRSGKMSSTFEFLRVFELLRKSKQSLRAAEKSQEKIEELLRKIEAKCTGFSAEFFDSQSVEMFCFARKTKMQMLTTSSRSLTRIHQRLLLIIRTLQKSTYSFIYDFNTLCSGCVTYWFSPYGTPLMKFR